MFVRKAIFPVAGLGTRFLPATKSVPKEMLTVVDKPLLQYAVEEARSAGIEQFIFVVSPNKEAVSNHFGNSDELERILIDTGKSTFLASVRGCQLPPDTAHFVVQKEPLGLGHAVWCAREFVGSEPFAVILPDDLVLAKPPCLGQMLAAWKKVGGNMVAVMDVPTNLVERYGVVMPGEVQGRFIEVQGLVEKPSPAIAPSSIAVVGRYIFLPDIFEHLVGQNYDVGTEIQLTDAMAALVGEAPFNGFRFDGTRYDCGDKVGFLEANIAFGLAREELRSDVANIVLRVADELKTG